MYVCIPYSTQFEALAYINKYAYYILHDVYTCMSCMCTYMSSIIKNNLFFLKSLKSLHVHTYMNTYITGTCMYVCMYVCMYTYTGYRVPGT